jgi:hypothetical protein
MNILAIPAGNPTGNHRAPVCASAPPGQSPAGRHPPPDGLGLSHKKPLPIADANDYHPRINKAYPERGRT